MKYISIYFTTQITKKYCTSMSHSPPAHTMQSKQWCCNKQPIPGGQKGSRGEASSWQASLFVGYITSSLGVCSLLPAWKWSLSKQSLAHTVHMGRRKGTTRVQEGEEGTRRRGGEGERREAGSAFDSCGLLAPGATPSHVSCLCSLAWPMPWTYHGLFLLDHFVFTFAF